MAYQRFFYLPSRSSLNVGTSAVYSPVTNYQTDQYRYAYTYPDSVPVYQVTTDPTRVPLTQSFLTSTIADTLTSSKAYTIYGRPFAKWAYELYGTTSISGTNFFANYWPEYHPYARYYRTRRTASTYQTYNAYYPNIYIEIARRSAIALACVYVWRPNVGVVGYLAGPRPIWGGWGLWGSSSSAQFMESRPFQPEGWGPNVPQFPTPDTLMYSYYGGDMSGTPPMLAGWGNNRGTVSGIQDHDCIVWEFWHGAMVSTANEAYNWPDNIGSTVQFIVGGGSSGQPMTTTTRQDQNQNNYDDPNWAPAWSYHYTPPGDPPIGGIEPESSYQATATATAIVVRGTVEWPSDSYGGLLGNIDVIQSLPKLEVLQQGKNVLHVSNTSAEEQNRQTRYTYMVSAWAHIQATLTKTATADAYIEGVRTKTATADAIIDEPPN